MKTPKYLAAAIAALFLLSSALGAGYMKLGDIKGESVDKDHKGWSDILSVSGLPAVKEKGSGLATGKRQHKPITIVKRIDKSSPLYQEASSSNNNPMYESKMSISQNGVIYELEGVKIERIEKKGQNEVLTLSYKSIKAKHDAAMNSVRNVKATNYNSSRSNKTSRAAAPEASPANHNVTRSK